VTGNKASIDILIEQCSRGRGGRDQKQLCDVEPPGVQRLGERCCRAWVGMRTFYPEDLMEKVTGKNCPRNFW
jgi:hypothetical protein